MANCQIASCLFRHGRHQFHLFFSGCFKSGKVRLKAAAAAGFIHSRGAHNDEVFIGDQALRVLGRIAALHADGKRFGDLVGHGKQLRHGMKGAAR